MKIVMASVILLSSLFLQPLLAQDVPTELGEPRAVSGQVDQLELRSSIIKGNAELPKVLYIVPWQSAGAGDLDGRPMNSLLDQVLAPVDRDVFLRHVGYFEQLSTPPVTDGAQN